jgi:ribosomal protein S27AE
MYQCPKCSNREIRGGKNTLLDAGEGGEDLIVYDFFCPRCGLGESMADDDPGLSDFFRRWESADPPGRKPAY